MKVLLLNETCSFGSTGRICEEIARDFLAKGDECLLFYGRGKASDGCASFARRIGNDLGVYAHVFLTRFFDLHGHGSVIATRKLIKEAEKYAPDLIWIHNIHGYYLNYPLFFRWVKKHPKIEIRWTLHDCWSFTGHCTYFSLYPCDQWQTHCKKCIQKKEYPSSLLFDRCRKEFDKKKKSFLGIQNMTLYTPSAWLAGLVQRSFMGCYPVEVHQNTVEQSVFHFRESNLRTDLKLDGKKVLLGAANIWDRRKGLEDFCSLAEKLDDSFQIVLVGLSQEQIENLPDNIIGLTRTKTPEELAKYYSMADLFLNPSKEETFGMTIVEASACGTDSIVYSGTACEEVALQCGGKVVPPNVEALYQAILSNFSERGKRQ